MNSPSGHSPLGASGAERWMECPGSTALLNQLDLGETDDPDYRVDGTTAHAGAALCLTSGCDAWEVMGAEFEGHAFRADMVAPVQEYVDYCRDHTPAGAQVFVEYRVHDPGVHEYFFGQVDYGWILDDEMAVYDYKHGEGIAVDCVGNPQPRYYAYGLMRHPDASQVRRVHLAIVQPRAFHAEGPIRTDELSSTELIDWAFNELVPNMNRALTDKSLMVGKHCRFCPAKLVCPALGPMYRAMATANPARIEKLDDAALSMEYRMQEAVQFYQKALREEALRRALQGSKFADTKLVAKKADRVFKPGAEERIAAQFGADAYTAPVFKTPPNIEKLGPEGRVLVKEWAFTPNTGYTMAPREDKRAEVNVQTGAEVFAEAAKRMQEAGE